MKKIIAKLSKHPWVYILCIQLLIMFIWDLMNSPIRLYPFLPESWYDAWLYFAVFRMQHFLGLGVLFLCLLTVVLIICSVFSRKARGWRKIKIVLLHVFLLLFIFGSLPPSRFKERTRLINCRSNLKQIYLALQYYASDNGFLLPPDLKTLSDTDYLTDPNIFRCPSQRLPSSEFSDYIYYGAGQKLEGKTPFILAKDRDKNHPYKYHNLIMSNGEMIPQNYAPD